MPVKSYVEEKSDTTIFSTSRDVTFQEIMDATISFYEQKPTLNVLFDFTGSPPSRFNSDQVARLARLKDRKSRLRSGGKTALVADLDCNFGVMRMFEALGKYSGLPFEVRVFRNVEEAREWLIMRDARPNPVAGS